MFPDPASAGHNLKVVQTNLVDDWPEARRTRRLATRLRTFYR